MTLPTMLTIVSTAIFFVAERLAPGRPLPHARGWYARALPVNLAQLGITLATGQVWPMVLGGPSLFSLASWSSAATEGSGGSGRRRSGC